MAENSVYSVVNDVVQLQKDEASMLSNGKGAQINSLRAGLVRMSEFLRNSRGKREPVEDLVSQIERVAEDADDIIETFVVNVAKLKRRKTTLDGYLRDPKHTTKLSEVLKEIKSIEDEILTIYRTKKYGIQMLPPVVDGTGADGKFKFGTRVLWRKFVNDGHLELFGLDKKIYLVRERLISVERKPREVFSFTGLTGAGKTSLAKAIYNDILVKKHFDCRAWTCASGRSMRELLLSILQSVNPFTEETHKHTDEENIEEELKCFLKKKRYLIVLEKVYNFNFFDRIRSALPDNSNDSRILITTHIKEVATSASSSYVHNVLMLDKENSWKLFCKMAFPDNDFPTEVVQTGMQIAARCEGIPFVIMLIGRLMAEVEKSGKAWSQLYDRIEPVENNYRDVMRLIYRLVPQPLKPCLLYFALFPKDYEIDVRKLIKMWIAEGFIKHSTTKDDGRRELEEIAEDYLEELVKRTLIKVVMRTDGGLKSCTMSGFFQDYCLSVQENFGMSILEESEESTGELPSPQKICSSKLRRLSIFCNPSPYISSSPPSSTCTSSVRSLLCFHNQDVLNLEKLDGFRSLRVLDFGDTVIHKVPADIKEFVHLRYLRMNAPHMREIPASISNLPVLETLDLRESGIVYFRQNFWKMQQLKHLFILGDCDLPPDSKKEVKVMPNLEILSTISPQMVNVFDFKTVFPKVRKLGLHSSRYIVGTRLPNLENVQTLKLINPFYFRFHPSAFSPTLTKLTLLRTEISSSVFATLGKISSLRALKLMKKSVAVWHIDCSEESFPGLQLLHMAELDVTKWTLKSKAMKILEYLVIKDCVELTEVPQQLKQVNSLRNVKVSGCTSNLLTSLRSTLGSNIRYEFQELPESESDVSGGFAGGALAICFH